MNRLKNIVSERPILIIGITLAMGLLMGRMFFGGSKSAPTNATAMEQHDHEQSLIHTCSMHPQIRNQGPGSCPICGMDLIPVQVGDETNNNSNAVILSASALQMAEVETSIVEKKVPIKELILSGKIKVDERKVMELTAHFPGRIEELSVNYTGQKVRKGQVLAKVFSSELITAQKELFEAIKLKDSNPKYYTSARNKFRLWLFTSAQINEIEKSGEIQFRFDILANGSGTVVQKNISMGSHIMEGMSMFQIVDLSHVWLEFDAYESDIPWIKLGSEVDIKLNSIPGKIYKSKITFIDPVLDEKTRTTMIRAELNNKLANLRPGMFAEASIHAMLSNNKEVVLVPKSAVLWTGKKAVVYIKKIHGESYSFHYREIILGENTGTHYVVVDGLMEGESVVTNGAFKIDAAAQLKGSQSMMNPDGVKEMLDKHVEIKM